MSNLGMGVMIRMLAGNAESAAAFTAAVGKTIRDIDFSADALTLWFVDGTGLAFEDRGQSCCEHRYMTNEGDTYAWAVGSTFVGADIKDAPSIEGKPEDYGEPHDCQFLEVQTSAGVITVTSHVEHNGYYGGFSIECSARVAP